MEINEDALVGALKRWFEAIKNLGSVQDELYREGLAVFIGKIGSQNRVTLTPEAMKNLDLKGGEYVLISVSRLKNKEGK